MSKLQNKFDEITVSEQLKERTEKRIRTYENSAYKRRNVQSNSVLAASDAKKTTKTTMKKRQKVLIACAISAILLFFAVMPIVQNYRISLYNKEFDFSVARQVRSEAQLSKLISYNTQKAPKKSLFSSIRDFEFFTTSAPDVMVEFDSNGRHSTTNVQVDGVDESDIVKNDGEYIYRLSSGGLDIIRAEDGNIEKVSEVKLSYLIPLGMYIIENQVVIIGGNKNTNSYDDFYDIYDGGMYLNINHYSVIISVYDITDKANPVETRYFQMEGRYHTSRLLIDNNTLYFIMNYYHNVSGYALDADKETTMRIPHYRTARQMTAQALSLEDIYYFEGVPTTSYMIIGNIDLADNESEVNVRAYLSLAYETYVSSQYIYTASGQYFYNSDGSISNYKTFIGKYSLETLDYISTGQVRGTINNRYSMDEYEGNFRVATTYSYYRRDSFWGSTENVVSLRFNGANAVYAFDENMNMLDSIMDIAVGESIDSASFAGNKGYISTSVKLIDPLFIIDFTDLSNLTISEGLKENGINMYLKSIADTDYVIGLGVEIDKIKLQMYDMSGAEAVSVEKFVIDGGYYADALSNPRAILYMYDEVSKKGIYGYSASAIDYSSGEFSQAFYLYEFDAEVGTMREMGILSNFEKTVLNYSDIEQYQLCFAMISRGIVIDGYLYTISDRVIASYDLDDLSRINVLDERG